METKAQPAKLDTVAARPLAELLDCPPAAGRLLGSSAETIIVEAGNIIFRQGDACRGLYVVVSGTFLRRMLRMNVRLTLGTARSGDLVELAAALGGGIHTYTLSGQTSGSLLMLPIEDLRRAFQAYPPLRMRLLEELAGEVSRAYLAGSIARPVLRQRRVQESGSSTAFGGR